MSEKPYTLIDRKTRKELGLSSQDAVLGPSVVDISGLYREQGIFTYDPGFGATACCSSTITFIDGEQGVLMYRGYPIEQLAEQSTFIEVASLLLYGELPSATDLEAFDQSIRTLSLIHISEPTRP